MTPITLQPSTMHSQNPAATAATHRSTTQAESADTTDTLELSPAAIRETQLTGRIAWNQEQGNISSDQAKQLYSQVSSIHNQIVADRQNDGGTLSTADAQTVSQMQDALRQTLYSEAHDGASLPSGSGSPSQARHAFEAGRTVLDQKTGR
ncbi:MAG TPA: hypothetical protein VMI94_17470 [Bryobacteraceae bacterium]|nr:hypothetical protein [Bryobacteraceae bacterium]